jgi:hypothetical protein
MAKAAVKSNPAEAAAKAPAETKATPAKKADKFITYRTNREDDVHFTWLGVRPTRPPKHPGHSEWRIPADQEQAADNHFHVQRGRIVKIKDA